MEDNSSKKSDVPMHEWRSSEFREIEISHSPTQFHSVAQTNNFRIEEESSVPVSTIQSRLSNKTHPRFNNHDSWKQKLRENCCKRVREDRSRLLWQLRLPSSLNSPPHSFRHCEQDFMASTFQSIVSDELNKIRNSELNGQSKITSTLETNDLIWEYDGLDDAYKGECEEILLEMQRVFYEDLLVEPSRKDTYMYRLNTELERQGETWEDEEDEFLARAVYEHMKLSDEKNEIWCPICKQGELRESKNFIICTYCKLRLNKDNEITLEFLRYRLADVHAEHFDRGCRSKPVFSIEARFDITALYICCGTCKTFEVVV